MLSLEPHLEGKTHVIWDWNGTLIDDTWLCHEITSQMLEEHELIPLTQDDHRSRFRMPVQDFYSEIGFDFAKVPFAQLAATFGTRYQERMLTCSLFKGVPDLLQKLHEKPATQAILSAANESHLKSLLKHFGIDHFFEHVFARNDDHAVSKIDRGVELLDLWKVSADRVILVGDMDHDWEVASHLGIDCLLLGDGHQHYDRLSKLSTKILASRYL